MALRRGVLDIARSDDKGSDPIKRLYASMAIWDFLYAAKCSAFSQILSHHLTNGVIDKNMLRGTAEHMKRHAEPDKDCIAA